MKILFATKRTNDSRRVIESGPIGEEDEFFEEVKAKFDGVTISDKALLTRLLREKLHTNLCR